MRPISYYTTYLCSSQVTPYQTRSQIWSHRITSALTEQDPAEQKLQSFYQIKDRDVIGSQTLINLKFFVKNV